MAFARPDPTHPPASARSSDPGGPTRPPTPRPTSCTCHPVWSPDETRVFMCCYFYGNAVTGESYNLLNEDTIFEGKPITSHSDLPIWNFDGSSTGQAVTANSEVIIKP